MCAEVIPQEQPGPSMTVMCRLVGTPRRMVASAMSYAGSAAAYWWNRGPAEYPVDAAFAVNPESETWSREQLVKEQDRLFGLESSLKGQWVSSMDDLGQMGLSVGIFLRGSVDSYGSGRMVLRDPVPLSMAERLSMEDREGRMSSFPAASSSSRESFHFRNVARVPATDPRAVARMSGPQRVLWSES